MKKRMSVLCLVALVWQIAERPSLATEAESPSVERPIHAAIAAAGANHSHLLSQIGSRPISRRQGTIIAVAAAIGFGVGYGAYYFENRPLDFSDERAHAMASGTFGAVIAGVIAWAVVDP